MATKVKIELRPYDALGILSFMREYVNDSNRHLPKLAAIHEIVDNYEAELIKKISNAMLEDALLENKVNQIAGRHPK